MPSRDWHIRIQDILHSARKAVDHTSKMDLQAFKVDEWCQDAVLRNLMVIGEAAGEAPDSIISKYPDIPWADMRDMRNIVVHEYFGVDLAIVWQTVRYDLPNLIRQLEHLIEAEKCE